MESLHPKMVKSSTLACENNVPWDSCTPISSTQAMGAMSHGILSSQSQVLMGSISHGQTMLLTDMQPLFNANQMA